MARATPEARRQGAKWLDTDGFLPLRLTGDVASPSVGLPGAGDILGARRGEIEEGAREALEDLLLLRRQR